MIRHCILLPLTNNEKEMTDPSHGTESEIYLADFQSARVALSSEIVTDSRLAHNGNPCAR